MTKAVCPIVQINKRRYNAKPKEAHKYEVGDYVVISNVITAPSINIHKVLTHYGYVITDVEKFQISANPCEAILDASSIKPFKPG